MRLNFFSRNRKPDPPPSDPGPGGNPYTASTPNSGKTFPADEVVWGIAIRNGFDEMDDPGYHKGVTQHAYLEGSDSAAICGFRPPQSGPHTRRRPRLGLPSAGDHPMCGMCARMVVAPRPRVPVPIQPGRPPVAIPVSSGPGPVGVSVTPGAAVPAGAAASTNAAPPPGTAPPQGAPASPWVQQRTEAPGDEPRTMTIDMGGSHDSGLLDRGVKTELED